MNIERVPEGIDTTTWALRSLAQGQHTVVQEALASLHSSDIAQLLESVPLPQRNELLALLSEDAAGSVIPLLTEEVRGQLLQDMPVPQLTLIVDQLDANDLVDSMDVLPEVLCQDILQALDTENLTRLNALLEYPEGSAGRMMSTDALSVRPDVRLSVVMRWLRKQSPLPAYTTSLMVTDAMGKFVGRLPMSAVVTENPDSLVESVMVGSDEVIRTDASEHDVARLFEKRHLITVPVLNSEDHLVGRITVDHAMVLLKKEADHRLLSSRGLSDEADLFAPILPSAKQRGIWLGINLVTVFLAAWVIGQFQVALDQLVALAVLMPIVASMGGIAGSQTLTLTIRGLALDQIVRGNVRWLATKELGVGALNGIAWALVVALVTYVWFQNVGLSLIIAAAMIVNLIAAALSGVAVPLTLKRIGFDPALAGAVVLTTVTDIVGFLSFLGLASWFLL